MKQDNESYEMGISFQQKQHFLLAIAMLKDCAVRMEASHVWHGHREAHQSPIAVAERLASEYLAASAAEVQGANLAEQR